MTEEIGAPTWWEAFSELRERSARIESKLDQALALGTDLSVRVNSLETDRVVVRSDVTANRTRISALEADKDARDFSPGAWKEWKLKVDGAVMAMLDSTVAATARQQMRAQDWAILGLIASVAVGVGGIVSRFLGS